MAARQSRSAACSCRNSQTQLETTDSGSGNHQPAAWSTPRKEHLSSTADVQDNAGATLRRAVVSRLQRGAAPPLNLCVGVSPPRAATLNFAAITPAGASALSPHLAAALSSSPHAAVAPLHRGTLFFNTSGSCTTGPVVFHRHVERSGSTSSGSARENAALETSLVRMRRSALGQSAPLLSFVPVCLLYLTAFSCYLIERRA